VLITLWSPSTESATDIAETLLIMEVSLLSTLVAAALAVEAWTSMAETIAETTEFNLASTLVAAALAVEA
jgi:hypothetical protein